MSFDHPDGTIQVIETAEQAESIFDEALTSNFSKNKLLEITKIWESLLKIEEKV